MIATCSKSVVTEYCLKQSGDDFDLFHTFDIEEARIVLADRADRGYRLNRKSPKDVSYIIFGYNVDTDEIDECYDYDPNNAKSLFIAYCDSQAYVDHDFCEPLAIDHDN